MTCMVFWVVQGFHYYYYITLFAGKDLSIKIEMNTHRLRDIRVIDNIVTILLYTLFIINYHKYSMCFAYEARFNI